MIKKWGGKVAGAEKDKDLEIKKNNCKGEEEELEVRDEGLKEGNHKNPKPRKPKTPWCEQPGSLEQQSLQLRFVVKSC